MKPQFIDTNVLLYAYDMHAGEPHQRARELVGRTGRERREVLSIQILQEFYVNAVKKVAVPLDPDTARERIRALSRWPVHSPTPDDVLVATEVSEQHRSRSHVLTSLSRDSERSTFLKRHPARRRG